MKSAAERSREQVVRKADRMRRARARPDDTLRHAARVGVLSWAFVTPVLIAAWIAKAVLRSPEQRWLALPMLAAGAVLGGLLVKNKVRQLLREGQREDEEEQREEERDADGD